MTTFSPCTKEAAAVNRKDEIEKRIVVKFGMVYYVKNALLCFAFQNAFSLSFSNSRWISSSSLLLKMDGGKKGCG